MLAVFYCFDLYNLMTFKFFANSSYKTELLPYADIGHIFPK